MLTFFDYLRQRAFEAVVAGVNDAFEYLDSHKSFDSARLPKPQKSGSSKPTEGEPANESPASGSHRSSQSDGITKSASDKPLPPRKRGRPRKSGGRNS